MLIEYIRDQKPFSWKKKGLVFKPDIPNWTHGSHPCALHLEDDVFLIAVTSRDENSRSHIFLALANVSQGVLTLTSPPKLALEPGQIGTFDCDGAIGVCLLRHKEFIYLYYVGWQNLPAGLWVCDTGRAIVDPVNLTLTREFEGPILGRDRRHPLFAAATAFYIGNDVWHTWYNSGIAWNKVGTEWVPRYGIHHATSVNGVDWQCEPGLVIPFKDEYEYAFGRPSVVVEDGVYYMWFAHRASAKAAQYRMGFAYSADGIRWNRDDDLAGIDVAVDGWDSEMVCYPYLFAHQGQMYILYNGNSYGKTGFCYAVLEGEK